MRRGVAGRGERLLANNVVRLHSARIKDQTESLKCMLLDISLLKSSSVSCEPILLAFTSLAKRGAEHIDVGAESRWFSCIVLTCCFCGRGNRSLGNSKKDLGSLNFAKLGVDFACWNRALSFSGTLALFSRHLGERDLCS